MTLIEKILAAHSKYEFVKPDDIVDISVDARVARDFGGANVVKNIRNFGLIVSDPGKTLFTFDCNPTGSDQKYAVNQHICRLFARENGIKVYDIDAGIGTHLLIDEGYVYPGATAVSTDSHANILGAVGAFGQGMGDQDIAAAWHKGSIWFKVPHSIRINLNGKLPSAVSAKDIVLNMLNIFGANSLLGHSIELYGDCVNKLTLDHRITISSMATEMGAVIILFTPDNEIIDYCSKRSGKVIKILEADSSASYLKTLDIDVSGFRPMVSRPGEPHDTVNVDSVAGLKIDSAFIGSCTNGRMSDMRSAAAILNGKKVAPGVVLKIVPATGKIWDLCLSEGILEIFRKAGAMISNPGCAGCAAGQVGQNGEKEVTISTGNRNFPGKQGKGSVWLASPEVVAASALAGYITTPDKIPSEPSRFIQPGENQGRRDKQENKNPLDRPWIIEGRAWIIERDNIDTDMIFHNRYLAITDITEMGQYTFDNLAGYENFAKDAIPGDIVIAGKNFGSGSSRQQAVDCFVSLGIQALLAESFGVIYERNAINAAFPILTYKINKDEIANGDTLRIDLINGTIINRNNNKTITVKPFNEVQIEIYKKGGLLGEKNIKT